MHHYSMSTHDYTDEAHNELFDSFWHAMRDPLSSDNRLMTPDMFERTGSVSAALSNVGDDWTEHLLQLLSDVAHNRAGTRERAVEIINAMAQSYADFNCTSLAEEIEANVRATW